MAQAPPDCCGVNSLVPDNWAADSLVEGWSPADRWRAPTHSFGPRERPHRAAAARVRIHLRQVPAPARLAHRSTSAHPVAPRAGDRPAIAVPVSYRVVPARFARPRRATARRMNAAARRSAERSASAMEGTLAGWSPADAVSHRHSQADRRNLDALGTLLDRAGIQASDFRIMPPRLTFAGEIMAAAGERDQHGNDGSGQRTLNTTRHDAENAWVSVKDCSTGKASRSRRRLLLTMRSPSRT